MMAVSWKCARQFSLGTLMPQFGLGTWHMRGLEQTKTAVHAAFNAGYRLIDTAQYYENEAEIGCALEEVNLPREEYFVTTKLLKHTHGYSNAKTQLMESLHTLKLAYVDLYLVHNPKFGKVTETWRAFEELKEEGLVRNIGVSNFNVHHLERLQAAGCNEMPLVNQIELHPWLQQEKVVSYCKERNIGIMAYCPLARGILHEDGKCPALDTISMNLKKTKSQVLIRSSLQKGYICIPKSANPKHIVENGHAFDFELSDDDMKQLDELECNMRVSNGAILKPWID